MPQWVTKEQVRERDSPKQYISVKSHTEKILYTHDATLVPQKGLFNLIFPTVSLSLPVCLSACLPSLCVSRRQTGGHEICSTCIRVNQPTLALQSTTPLGSWSERLGRRDSCVVDTQTSPATYPLFSKASRRYSTHTHTVHWFQSLNQRQCQTHCAALASRWTVSSLPQP